jgi:integrase
MGQYTKTRYPGITKYVGKQSEGYMIDYYAGGERHRERAGIKGFHFHDLRHTSAFYLVMRGASMKAVQEHLGHTSLTMTERYSHLSPDFHRTEIERLNGLCGDRSQKTVRSGQNVDEVVSEPIQASA